MHIILSLLISTLNSIQLLSFCYYNNLKCKKKVKELTILEALKQEFSYFKLVLPPGKIKEELVCSNDEYDLTSVTKYYNITNCYPNLCPESMNLQSTNNS